MRPRHNAAVKKVLLNLYIWPVFLAITLAGILVAPWILLANLLLFHKPADQLVRRGIRLYGWLLVRIVPFMAPVTLEDRSGGIETPVIFTPNHTSSVDPYLFGLLPYENAFITSWPFNIPVYNLLMRMARYINSNEGWDRVQAEGRALLDRGCSLIIWPEGHRTRSGALGRFRSGAFRLACLTGRPVVPVCIIGSYQLMAAGSRLLTPSRVKMILLAPIYPEGPVDDPLSVQDLRSRTKQAIDEELSRHGMNQAIQTASAQPLENKRELAAHEH